MTSSLTVFAQAAVVDDPIIETNPYVAGAIVLSILLLLLLFTYAFRNTHTRDE